MWNEFLVLVLYGQILCQTDYIENPIRRINTGWSLIGVLTLAVVTNFGYVLYSEVSVAARYLRLRYFKVHQTA